MKQVTQNTEFIIGIDFGHGETSAAFYDLKNQEKKDLDILPGLKVVKSAVAILEQEGNWYKVKYQDKITGYVSKDLISATQTY